MAHISGCTWPIYNYTSCVPAVEALRYTQIYHGNNSPVKHNVNLVPDLNICGRIDFLFGDNHAYCMNISFICAV